MGGLGLRLGWGGGLGCEVPLEFIMGLGSGQGPEIHKIKLNYLNYPIRLFHLNWINLIG